MNSETCERLYNTYYMRVFSYIMTMAGDRHTAEEITQEAFFKAFSKSSSFRNESDEVTWLCAIAKNLFVDEKRRQSRFTDAPISEEQPDTGKSMEESLADADASLRIHRVLHNLDEPYKEVFQLRVFGGLSFKEIGSIFGKTETWARVTFHRARMMVKERMEKS